MTKVDLYVKQGTNTYVFQEGSRKFPNQAKLLLSNVKVFWRFQNIESDITVTLTDQNGVTTNVLFQEGYWSFLDLKKRFGEESVVLTTLPHNNTCRFSSNDYDVNLGELGPLLGFERGKVILRASATDSGRVNINLGLEYVTVAFESVDSTKFMDRYGQPTNIVAVLPVDTTQRLNGTFALCKDQVFEAPFNGGNLTDLHVTIRDNLPRNLIKLYLLCEVDIV